MQYALIKEGCGADAIMKIDMLDEVDLNRILGICDKIKAGDYQLFDSQKDNDFMAPPVLNADDLATKFKETPSSTPTDEEN